VLLLPWPGRHHRHPCRSHHCWQPKRQLRPSAPAAACGERLHPRLQGYSDRALHRGLPPQLLLLPLEGLLVCAAPQAGVQKSMQSFCSRGLDGTAVCESAAQDGAEGEYVHDLISVQINSAQSTVFGGSGPK
jgi:hypothetical protein